MGYIFIALVVGFFYLIDVYVFQGVKTFARNFDNVNTQDLVIRFFWILNNAFYILVAAAFLTMDREKGAGTLQIVALNVFITLIVPKLVFSGVLWIEDISRLFTGIYNAVFHRVADNFFPERRAFFAQLAMGAAAIPFGAIVYGIFKGKYDYRVHKHTIFFPDLPEAFDGFKITQLSDIHSGSFDNPEAVKRGVALANAQQSDILVFTGDLVNNEAKEIEPYLDIFKALDAPFGKYSILGNHDYGDYKAWASREAKAANFKLLQEHHAAMNFRLLMDENVTIEKNGQQISLIGVENWGHGFAQYGDFATAMQGVAKDSFKVLLSHDPTHWEKEVKLSDSHVHLTLSGHTHGAQMGVEIGSFKWSPIKFRYPKWAGLYEEAGRYLHINRGFGFLAFAGRVGILPEITVIELKKG
jgi:uncharacterized protein